MDFRPRGATTHGITNRAKAWLPILVESGVLLGYGRDVSHDKLMNFVNCLTFCLNAGDILRISCGTCVKSNKYLHFKSLPFQLVTRYKDLLRSLHVVYPRRLS